MKLLKTLFEMCVVVLWWLLPLVSPPGAGFRASHLSSRIITGILWSGFGLGATYLMVKGWLDSGSFSVDLVDPPDTVESDSERRTEA